MRTLILSLLLATALSAQTADRAPVGKTVTLEVTADGTPPLTYQWFKDGVPMGGQTVAKLVLAPFLSDHAGVYHAAVSNEAGSTQSNKVQLVPVKAPSKSTVTVSIAVGVVNP